MCVWPLKRFLTGPWSETFTGSTSAKTLISAPTEREERGRKLERGRERERRRGGKRERIAEIIRATIDMNQI